MKRGDIWLAAIILIPLFFLSLQMFGSASGEEGDTGIYARITVDGEHFRTVPLDEGEQMIEIQTRYGYNLLQVTEGGIRMLEADCPDDLCILLGTKNRVGEMIVCLPNRLLVEIIGDSGEEAEVDAIAS